MVKSYSTPGYSMSTVRRYNKTTQRRPRLTLRRTPGRLPAFVSPPSTRLYPRSAVKRKLASLTKTKAPIRRGKVQNEGTGGQYSYFSGPKGASYLPPHVENALPPQVIQNNAAGQLKSAVGLQNVAVPIQLFVPSVATSYTSDKVSHVLYDKATADLTLNNIYLSNCYLIIYDIIARKDVSSASFNTPLSAWSQGDTDLSETGAYTFLGSTPWQSELFNQYFKVCQVTNIVLGSGATHVHKINLSPKRLISSAYGTYTTGGFKDVTYYCMVEIHGSPANDTTTQTQVSVGVGGVNYVLDQEVHLKQIQKSTPSLNSTNSLLTSFTVAEQVVNLGGSLIMPNAEG